LGVRINLVQTNTLGCAHWLPLVFYTIGLLLTLTWTSPGKWDSRCGSEAAIHFFFCEVFAGASLCAAAYAGFAWRDWSAIIRFVLSGGTPVAFPWVVSWLKGFLLG
jgi:hypothetical protein